MNQVLRQELLPESIVFHKAGENDGFPLRTIRETHISDTISPIIAGAFPLAPFEHIHICPAIIRSIATIKAQTEIRVKRDPAETSIVTLPPNLTVVRRPVGVHNELLEDLIVHILVHIHHLGSPLVVIASVRITRGKEINQIVVCLQIAASRHNTIFVGNLYHIDILAIQPEISLHKRFVRTLTQAHQSYVLTIQVECHRLISLVVDAHVLRYVLHEPIPATDVLLFMTISAIPQLQGFILLTLLVLKEFIFQFRIFVTHSVTSLDFQRLRAILTGTTAHHGDVHLMRQNPLVLHEIFEVSRTGPIHHIIQFPIRQARSMRVLAILIVRSAFRVDAIFRIIQIQRVSHNGHDRQTGTASSISFPQTSGGDECTCQNLAREHSCLICPCANDDIILHVTDNIRYDNTVGVIPIAFPGRFTSIRRVVDSIALGVVFYLDDGIIK